MSGKIDHSVDEGQLRRAWVSEDVLDTLAAQDFEQERGTSAAAHLAEFRNRICCQAAFLCVLSGLIS
jgi:hypothetical protein